MFYGGRGRFGLLCGLAMRVVGVVVVVEVVIGVDSLLVIFARLHLTTIAFLAETKIEVVAFDADPVLVGMLGV